MSGTATDLVSADCSIHACLAGRRPPAVVTTDDAHDAELHVADGAFALDQQYVGIVCSRKSPMLREVREQGSFALTVLPAGRKQQSEAWWRDAGRMPARHVKGTFVRGGTLYLECVLDRMVERLGDSVLIVAGVMAAWQEAQPAEQNAGEAGTRDPGYGPRAASDISLMAQDVILS